MKTTISMLMVSLCVVLTQAPLPCQANNKVQTHTTVTRNFNSNWQAEIISKHPNANHFYWTPMTVTTARTVKNGAPARARSAYRNRKPVVVAWNSYESSKKQAQSKPNSETTNLQGTPTLTYGSTNASLYGPCSLSAQLNGKRVTARIYGNHK